MKTIFITLFLCALVLSGFSQAKKPTIMVIPSDVWCNQHGFITKYDNQGTEMIVPDYKKALQTDPDLLLAISKIGEMMTERGFPLKDLSSCLKSLETAAAEESVATSKDGQSLAETPIEKLRKTAKADIWMELTWTINRTGPKKSLTFNLQGKDAYTDKQIAAASGTGQPSFSVELPVLLEESILAYIDKFNDQLQTFFDDLLTNGREVSLLCKRWDGCETDFETEFDGDELSFLIEDWVAQNTVEGRFSTTDASQNRMLFEQVRIPVYNQTGRAIDTRTWANDLRKMLKSKYEIEAKLETKGLGQAIITIGAK